MMDIKGGRQAKQRLDQPVDVGRAPQVVAAQHMGHAHRRIVQRAGEMIAGGRVFARQHDVAGRSEEHTSELQSLMRISYAVFCLKKKNTVRAKDTHRYIINVTSQKDM